MRARSMVSTALVIGLVASGLAPRPAAAQADESEREVLARLTGEMSVLERLVYEAEQRAQSADRVFFDYRGLRADLQRIRDGVSDTRLQPRIPAPVQGDYVRTDAAR